MIRKERGYIYMAKKRVSLYITKVGDDSNKRAFCTDPTLSMQVIVKYDTKTTR